MLIFEMHDLILFAKRPPHSITFET